MALTTITLSLPGVKLRPGSVALDCGGTMAKLAYAPNKAQEAADTIHLVTVPLKQKEDLVKIIKENCDLDPNDEGQRIIDVTGASACKIWSFLEDNLNAKLSMHMETSASVRGLKHLLENLGPDQCLEPYTDDLIEDALKVQIPITAAIMKRMGRQLPQVDETASPRARLQGLLGVNLDVPAGLSKYMLLSLGSGSISIKVDGEQELRPIDIMTGVGKTFHALGKLITGKQSYAELLELAEKGNSLKVNTVMQDLVSRDTGAPTSVYSILPEESVCYFLGKVADDTKSRDDFAPEDLMAGLLENTCCNIVHRCLQAALANDIDTVFFMGGFVDSPVVRRTLYRYSLMAAMSSPGKKVNFHIVKYPSYIEVMGCLLSPPESSANPAQQSENGRES